MTTVNICGITSPGTSFFIVTQNLRAWIEPNYRTTITIFPDRSAKIRIYIGEVHNPWTRNRSWWYFVHVWWVDTALYFEGLRYSKVLSANPIAEVWVTSTWNARFIADFEELMNQGKARIVPRVAHPLYFLDYPDVEKEYDFIIIATNIKRKNVPLFRKICRELKAKCLEISPEGDIKTWSLTECQKIKLLLKSKYLVFPSRSEGFGMPVLEANLLGIPAIYTKGHALVDFAKGFGIPVKEIRDDYEPVGLFKSFEPDEQVALALAEMALRLTKDEYQDLSERIKEQTRRWQLEVIDFVNQWIEERA